ncbi:MAG: O-antigen ligase family protein [Pirellulaceae bacterium]
MATATAEHHWERDRAGQTVRHSALTTLVTWCLVYAIVFINAADFRGDTGEQFTVHWQIYLRLMICGACGMLGLALFSKSFHVFMTFPGFMMTLLIAWIGITLPFSIDRNFSIAAFVSLGAVTLLIPAAIQVLGAGRFLLAVAAGLITFLIGSWIAYLFFPEIGIFKEQVSQTEVVQRMGGLGHPNELGLYSAFTAVLFAVLGYARRLPWWLAGTAILLAFATLVVCFSRTSIAIAFVGLLVVFRHELLTRHAITNLLLLSVLLLPVLFYVAGTGQLDWYIDDALQKVSKSGTSDELTTATGRTEIWAYALKMIGEQPLHGYGYVTARFVMEDHSYHCHNIVLNMSLYTGVVGGLLLMSILFYLGSMILREPRYEVDGLMGVILAGGLIDGMLFAPVPSASILILTSALVWRQLDMQLERLPRHADVRRTSLPAKA